MSANVSRTGMPAARWAYLKALQSAAPRYLHKSAECGMRLDPVAKALGIDRYVPWVQKPGVTYNVGRNAVKRQARLLRRAAAGNGQRISCAKSIAFVEDMRGKMRESGVPEPYTLELSS